MGFSGIFAMLVIGAIVGWLSGKIMEGRGFGLLGNIVIGILGAFQTGTIFPALGFSIGSGLLGSILFATTGAAILIFAIGPIRR